MPADASMDAGAALEEFLHTAPIGVAILDRDLQYVWTNRALTAMSGPAVTDAGAPFGTALPELAARLAPLLTSVMDADTPAERTVHGGPEPEAGGGRSWRACYIPLHDDGGNVVGLGALVVEITREARLERAQNVLDRIGAELSTLDAPEAVAAAVPELLVRDFVDTAVLYARETDGSHRLLSARGDAEWLAIVERDYATLPPDVAPWADRVIASGRPRVVSTAEFAALLGEPYREVSEAGTRISTTTAVLPLVHAGESLGLLFVGAKAPDFFDEDNLGMLLEIGRITAATLYFTRLTNTVRNEKRRAELLQDLGFRLARAETADEVSDAVLSVGAELLGAAVAGIGVIDSSRTELVERWRDLRRGGEHEAKVTTSRRGSLLTASFARRAVVVAAEPSELEGSFAGCDTEGIRSGYALPLPNGDGVIGAISFGFADEHAPTDAQRTAAALAGDLCAAALERIALDEARTEAIAQFQRSLLPDTLPSTGWLDVGAVFRPSPAPIDIAGDWYDAFVRADGSICLIVADVAGKGMRAATTVGALRHILRLHAHEHDDPAAAIDATEHAYLLGASGSAPDFATVCLVVIDPGGAVRISLAGHLPPLRVWKSGAGLVEGRTNPPLGVPTTNRSSFVTTLEVGQTLLLYTDGLVERRREPLDASLERLARAARRLPADARSATALPAALLDVMAPENDDIAIIAATRTA